GGRALFRTGHGRGRPHRATRASPGAPVRRHDRGRRMTRSVQVRLGSYQDSVSLMQVSRELQDRDGVTSALVAMATQLNLGLLADMGFEPPPEASPNDMLVAIDAENDAAVDDAITALDAALVRRPPSGD